MRQRARWKKDHIHQRNQTKRKHTDRQADGRQTDRQRGRYRIQGCIHAIVTYSGATRTLSWGVLKLLEQRPPHPTFFPYPSLHFPPCPCFRCSKAASDVTSSPQLTLKRNFVKFLHCKKIPLLKGILSFL